MRIGRALLVVAGLLVFISTLLPLWGMTMIAPQYPDGLHVRVYPGDLQGDLSIINVLNHYVGMRSLHMEDFVEVLILPYLLAAIGVGLIVAGLFSKRGIAIAMVVLLLLTAIAGFAELRRTLVEYGTDLDPMAPLDLEPFVPPIVGRYVVWNFEIHHSFMAGTYMLFLASVLAFVGCRRLGPSSSGTSERKMDNIRDKTKTKREGRTREHGTQQPRYVGLFLIAAIVLTVGTSAEAVSSASAPPGEPAPVAAPKDTEVPLSAPTEIVVSPDRSPTLSEALATVADGGTVRVRPGVYEGPFVIDRGVTLIADTPYGRDGHGSVGNDDLGASGSVEIVGEGELVVVAGGGSLIGVTVRHVGTLVRSDEAAVRLWEHGGTVRDNTIMFDTAHGIYVERGGNHVIQDNVIIGRVERRVDDRGNGLFLFDTERNHIENNRIAHARDGIYLHFAGMDTIVGNDVSYSRYGIHSMFSSDIVYEANRLFKNVVGSAFMYSKNMELARNVIVDHSDHRGYAILLKDGNRNRLVDNYIVGNNLGLFFDLSDENEIENNIFAANNLAVELFSSSVRNRIVGNSFIGNRVDTLLHPGRHSTVWWTERAGGNYWDTYRGVDVDGFGFGALPHTSADAFGFITRNNPELKAFYLGPSVEALAWAEQAFPLLRVPRVTDERPRVQPDQAALAEMRRHLAALGRPRVSPIHMHDFHAPAPEGSTGPALVTALGLLVGGIAIFGPLFRRTGAATSARG